MATSLPCGNFHWEHLPLTGNIITVNNVSLAKKQVSDVLKKSSRSMQLLILFAVKPAISNKVRLTTARAPQRGKLNQCTYITSCALYLEDDVIIVVVVLHLSATSCK